MKEHWILNICPFLHFDNARINTYEHNVSIAAWNIKSIIDYLEVNSSHKFSIGQVTLLEGFKRLFPNYWDQLHQSILEGRVEIVGGTYVSPDFIIPDGESIIRQFQYGMRFFKEELGITVKTGWALDSYGHNAQLPQILRQCGLESYYFYRGMPFQAPSEFVWKGPDGSRIDTIWLMQNFDSAEWLSENTFEAFTVLMDLAEKKKKASVSNNLFLPVGGVLVPPLPHLADIIKKWNETFLDMRSVILTPLEFSEKLKISRARNPVISGELNSGRFSTIASGGLSSRVSLKMKNRELETLLYLTELFLGFAGDSSKQNELDNIWKMLLFNQDHNIIRGICADTPAKLAEKRFDLAISTANELLEKTVATLASDMSVDSAVSGMVVFNPVSWGRSDLVIVPVDGKLADTGKLEVRDHENVPIPHQLLNAATEGESPQIAFIARDMPPLGYRLFRIVETEQVPSYKSKIQFDKYWIESDRFLLEFDDFNGSLIRFRDKKFQYEFLRDVGSSIVFESDLGDLYRSSRSELSSECSEFNTARNTATMKVIESGPVLVRIEVEQSIEGTQVTQHYTCYDGIKRIDVQVELDSKVRNRRVRAVYPLNIFSDSVIAGSQFLARDVKVERDMTGYIEASRAISALDWLSCTGPDASMILSAIGLHEFEYLDGDLMCTLFRSVDQLSRGIDDDSIRTKQSLELGKHLFSLSLIPHGSDIGKSIILQSAAEHRLALLTFPVKLGETQEMERSILSIEGANMMVSCYKPGTQNDEVILRLFETEGRTEKAKITLCREIEEAALVDLLERDIGQLPVDGKSVSLTTDPFGIVTMRITYCKQASNVQPQ
ncbi:hypothetical protein EU537_08420 [Candidatus Thorarchaeota archaeon]|nr:MAG: hypothetical protein EU537_08420 [Candidatus Thorarchaeota archaeon]